MAKLQVYQEDNSTPVIETNLNSEIKALLNPLGVVFEQWKTYDQVASSDIADKYKTEIEDLMAKGGYKTFDVIAMTAEHPEKATLRKKFLSEHTHSEDEVRYFVEGKGLFTLHIDSKVYSVMCEKGDLISVPANTLHWFDMGANPNFTCIRIFTNPEGWVANFSGNSIADDFPRFEEVK